MGLDCGRKKEGRLMFVAMFNQAFALLDLLQSASLFLSQK